MSLQSKNRKRRDTSQRIRFTFLMSHHFVSYFTRISFCIDMILYNFGEIVKIETFYIVTSARSRASVLSSFLSPLDFSARLFISNISFLSEYIFLFDRYRCLRFYFPTTTHSGFRDRILYVLTPCCTRDSSFFSNFL